MNVRIELIFEIDFILATTIVNVQQISNSIKYNRSIVRDLSTRNVNIIKLYNFILMKIQYLDFQIEAFV